MEPIIQIRNLTKTFGQGDNQVSALRDVSLTVEKGEIFGIIGLSGAGKSTLVRCMNLLERPAAGQVVFQGRELTAMNKKELGQQRKKIAMIFQSFNLLAQRTSLQNILFPMELAGGPQGPGQKRAIELLDTVGLPDKADSYPSQLSGGQKQRVAIARALAGEPEVLLCDEATSALDPTTTVSILKLLREINRKTGITVVIITHQMSVIEQICSRVAILDQGRVAELGRVEDIFSNPKTEAGRKLVFPDGVKIPIPTGQRLLRIAFNGGASEEPVIASLALDLGVRVSIMGADTRDVDGKAFGTMLITLPEEEGETQKILHYLGSQPGISLEVVQS